MARQPGAGDLYYRVAFDRRGTGSDGGGGMTTAFAEQFQCRAAYLHIGGSEAVTAARLEGRHMQIIRVRASSNTRSVAADWRIRDARNGDVFNIRDIVPSRDRAWLDFHAEKGVPA